MRTLKPSSERLVVKRSYDNVNVLVRKLFGVPKDEMVLDLVWDKNQNELVLTTLRD